jgi:hypothetical protein
VAVFAVLHQYIVLNIFIRDNNDEDWQVDSKFEMSIRVRQDLRRTLIVSVYILGSASNVYSASTKQSFRDKCFYG